VASINEIPNDSVPKLLNRLMTNIQEEEDGRESPVLGLDDMAMINSANNPNKFAPSLQDVGNNTPGGTGLKNRIEMMKKQKVKVRHGKSSSHTKQQLQQEDTEVFIGPFNLNMHFLEFFQRYSDPNLEDSEQNSMLTCFNLENLEFLERIGLREASKLEQILTKLEVFISRLSWIKSQRNPTLKQLPLTETNIRYQTKKIFDDSSKGSANGGFEQFCKKTGMDESFKTDMHRKA
jgi:hypothetical protein